ncbi:MAG: GGDEF domain-containing protein [Desulfobulbaceae bacterium]|nr:GGDEF domain-containing protein [Desulfobulbaceae bacterium]HIJ89951.1 GGDEF domain-containing protein [Deltaproteobacteria bacterium]
MDHNDVERLERVNAQIHALLHDEQPGILDLTGQQEDTIRQLGESLNTLTEALSALTHAAHHLSTGDLDVQVLAKLPAGHHLKNLQSTLRHLNLQAEEHGAQRQGISARKQERACPDATDSLTGVYSRRYFMDFATKEFLRSQRYSHIFSVIQMDIDHLKKINDTHGRAVGDEVLKAFGANCLEVLRESDVLGRIGGEEFSIILPETEMEGALIVAERVRRSIADLKVYTNVQIVHFTVSIGVTSFRQDDSCLDDVLKRADEALYLAKNAGRNKVVSTG